MEELDREIERKLQGTDLVNAVHKAKLRSTRLLEEQGISTLALILSKTLVDVIEQTAGKDGNGRLIRMRIYLESTVLAALTHFRNIEKERYKSVSKLLEICKERQIGMIVSFYTVHEIFLLAFDYFDKTTEQPERLVNSL